MYYAYEVPDSRTVHASNLDELRFTMQDVVPEEVVEETEEAQGGSLLSHC